MSDFWLLNSRDSMLLTQTLKFYFHDYARGKRERGREREEREEASKQVSCVPEGGKKEEGRNK